MKKVVYIALVLGVISITSCQKNEFEDIITESKTNESLQTTSDGEVIDSGRYISSENEFTSTSSTEIEFQPWEKEIIEINIKEVSDGDDEADDGDDSKTD